MSAFLFIGFHQTLTQISGLHLSVASVDRVVDWKCIKIKAPAFCILLLRNKGMRHGYFEYLIKDGLPARG